MRSLCVTALGGVLFLCASAGAQAESRPGPTLDGARPAAAEDVDMRGVVAMAADFCFNAPLISGTGLFPFNNVNAGTDGLAHPVNCTLFADPQISQDVWWLWRASCEGLVRVETCGLATIDTELAVYSPGAICSPNEDYLLVCDDDTCDVRRTSVTFVAVPGQQYLIRLGVYINTPGGSGNIRISCAEESVCRLDDCQTYDQVSAYRSGGVNWRVAESFVPASSGAVTSLCWWGAYDGGPQGNPPADAFRITYYNDVGGAPGVPFATFVQGSSLGTPARRDTGDLIAGFFNIFEYSACHGAVPVAKGVRYWVEIVNVLGQDSWGWATSVDGDVQMWQDPTVADNYGDANNEATDVALCVGLDSACFLDVDGDGFVGFGDLNQILSSFNTPCP